MHFTADAVAEAVGKKRAVSVFCYPGCSCHMQVRSRHTRIGRSYGLCLGRSDDPTDSPRLIFRISKGKHAGHIAVPPIDYNAEVNQNQRSSAQNTIGRKVMIPRAVRARDDHIRQRLLHAWYLHADFSKTG